MSSRLSKRATALSPSPTLALDARAKEMQKQGIDVVNFGIGEPDFDTPAHIKESGIQAIQEGFTKYTPAAGIPELKEAVCKKLKEDNGLDYEPAQVVVSVGAKHAIYNAVQALCDDGDEVIVPAPYWVSYTEIVKLSGGKPVEVVTSEASGFKMTAAQLEAAVTPKTRMLILNSPSNPTGAVYDEAELRALGEVCAKHGIYIISDEIYEKLVYGGTKHVSVASFDKTLKDLTVVINGVSKAFAMTGWRIGYAAAAKDIAKAMGDFQSQVTSNPASMAQKAAVSALLGPKEPVFAMVKAFEKRRDFVVKRLNSMKGVKCYTPGGAFYVYPNLSSYIGKRAGGCTCCGGTLMKDSAALADLILQEARVAVVPGTAFGMDGYVRISYATSMENLEKGLDRIETFLKGIKG
ncbi:MAG: pyridoxal phosphate-dependent aminotransferase [Firmicutes bacterium]|nr:pyridoxal phosphate-dependent aminotransferase [Bacillota bacterium]